MSKSVPFILQLHQAKRAGKHYDLRLQLPYGNKLASWAIPKANLPKKIGDKVLAIKTQDHDKSWLRFQGDIPGGSYGAGNVKIEQKGSAEILGWHHNKVIKFKVTGSPMHGNYALIKFKGTNSKENSWLLVKSKDQD